MKDQGHIKSNTMVTWTNGLLLATTAAFRRTEDFCLCRCVRRDENSFANVPRPIAVELLVANSNHFAVRDCPECLHADPDTWLDAAIGLYTCIIL